MRIGVFVSGRNYELTATIPEELTVAEGATLDDFLQQLRGLLPDGRQLAGSCVVAVSGRHCGTLASHRPEALRDGDEVVILAPVAGG
jgi:molybdopterin converting factor small subunit